jgi:hypothetical protein
VHAVWTGGPGDAHGVTGAGLLDVNDVRAEIRQKCAGERTC